MAFFSNGLSFFFIVIFLLVSLSSISALPSSGSAKDPVKFILGEENLGPWKISQLALAPGPASDTPQSTLVLAEHRTKRPDILSGFRRYQGGWDISNRHYWASVGFTGAAGFILAVLWFVSFGLAIGVHLFCGWRINIKTEGSSHSQRICLIMLVIFTCAAATGCVLLSVGQNEFHGEALCTLNYVVNQSDYSVETLRNVTAYLSLAKTINVAQFFLPSDVMDDIDKLNVDLNTAADTLNEKTNENSVKIKRVFNAVRSALIAIAVVMLVLALTGLVLSILGHQHAILIFIVTGWLLVAITFILCGVFVILNNAISDTCMAMGEWIENPHAESALSNILPCVDQRTTNRTLFQSKQVITNIVTVVNQFMYNYANANPPQGNPMYYNQSGPQIPTLCYPFNSQLQNEQCGDQDVSFTNASLVWHQYVCEVSASGLCTTVGRVTPEIYSQLVAAVNESYALDHYVPPLLSLQDCNFVRDTFQEITSNYCPPLDHDLKIINVGLGLISVGVLLCLVLWILYANRPQREEAFVKLFIPIKLSGSSKNIFDNSGKNDKLASNPSGGV
ncbi:putative Transmembrane protein [Quillaja saponaria]|uniref:Transmembrane protein n=1 Tax=Quillaja saponaria TaxID=32244 RepID=A0AAD7PGN3_QUISA|nr:putative Transmembrane protein [Quillaja saponaria]